ncbi:membrane lipoprotein lipid attachment site-containing protein [Bacillus sp. A116_S68]|nr:membrane lipoprotein lipid attachment site-containing protein [Bacillus sp. A116_S68]
MEENILHFFEIKRKGFDFRMKKILAFISIMIILQGCNGNNDESFDVNWSEYSDTTVERLESNGIKYEIRDGNVYIPKKDHDKAVACCS